MGILEEAFFRDAFRWLLVLWVVAVVAPAFICAAMILWKSRDDEPPSDRVGDHW